MRSGVCSLVEPLWSLYNQLEKLRIDDLKTEHVRIILLAIPTRRMGQWYACREGDMTWQLISDIPDFYEDVRAMKGLSPAGEAQSDKAVAEEVKKADMLETRGFKQAMLTEKPKALSAKGALKAGPKPSKPPTIKSGHNERRPLFEDASTDFNQSSGLNIVSSPIKERRSARRYPRSLAFVVRHKDQIFETKTKDISIGGISLSEPLPAWIPKTFRAKVSHNKQIVRVICSRVTESKLRIVEAESWDVIRSWIVKW